VKKKINYCFRRKI